jgi:CHAD domain-containing protein
VRQQVFTSGKIRSGDVAAELGAAGFEIQTAMLVRRTVLDTFDGRLVAAGLRLELRESNERELVLTGGGSWPVHVAVSGPPSVADDLPSGPFRARLGPVLGLRALLPLLMVAARQTVAVRRDRAGKILVRVVIQDEVAIDGRLPTSPSLGVEVDELVGYEAAALDARNLLRAIGLKARRGELLDLVAARAGVSLCGYDVSPKVNLARDEPAGDGFRRVLAGLAVTIDANLDGTIRAVDPEFLHDLRIAVRRTRAVLSEARGVLPRADRARFRGEFRWLGSVTSAARDMDVYVIEWPGYVAPLGRETVEQLRPVLDLIVTRRTEEHVALAASLTCERLRELLVTWKDWLESGDTSDARGGAPQAEVPLGDVVARRLVAAQDRLLKSGRAIGSTSPAEDLHELRKEAKKLRYLIECFGGVLSAGPRKEFVKRLKALQDNLGEFQDAEVHSDRLRGISLELHEEPGTTAATMVAIGQLTEHFELRRQAARNEFAERFAAYDTKASRQCLDEVARSAAAG